MVDLPAIDPALEKCLSSNRIGADPKSSIDTLAPSCASDNGREKHAIRIVPIGPRSFIWITFLNEKLEGAETNEPI